MHSRHAKWDDVERLLHEEWKLRRTNAPGITTPLIDKLIAAARKQGARAAKVCGAGGGGCVIVLVEEGSRERVHEAIRKNGGQPLDFQVARNGLRFHGPKPSNRRRVAMFTDDDGRLQPIWAFVLSALLSCVAFLVAGYSAAALAGDHVLRFEVIFRPLLVGLAAGSLQLAADGWQSRRRAPHRRARAAAVAGLGATVGHRLRRLGFVLVIVAVVPVAIWGSVSFRLTLNLHSVARDCGRAAVSWSPERSPKN